MPYAAPRACRCGRLQPCPVHVRKAWDHKGRTRQERGLDAEYARNRAIVMREETHCWLCHGPGLSNDQADHVIARARGGTNERLNLRRAHRRCNLSRKSSDRGTGTDALPQLARPQVLRDGGVGGEMAQDPRQAAPDVWKPGAGGAHG